MHDKFLADFVDGPRTVSDREFSFDGLVYILEDNLHVFTTPRPVHVNDRPFFKFCTERHGYRDTVIYDGERYAVEDRCFHTLWSRPGEYAYLTWADKELFDETLACL